MSGLDLTRIIAGTPESNTRLRRWQSEVPPSEWKDLPVAPTCEHGHADPAVCPDCVNPPAPIDPAAVMQMPAAYRAARLSDLPKALLDAIGPFTASWPPARPALWLGGNVGAGKTHTACAILRHMYELRGVQGRFWTVADILQCYREASDPDYAGPWTAALLDDALRLAPLLVIDDLGTERWTEFAAETLYRVVDARYREQRPTIVTTNVPADAIDPRIRSRMLSGVQVNFTGPDRRVM